MKKFKRIISLMAMLTLVVMLMPVKTFAAANPEYSDEFKKYLTDDGKLIVHSVPFSQMDNMDKWLAGDIIYTLESKSENDNIYVYFDDESGELVINEDYTKADIVHYYGDISTTYVDVPIEYVYDEGALAAGDEAETIFGELDINNSNTFKVSDLEVINFLYNSNDPTALELANYSGELKKFVGNRNFELDVRAGDDNELLRLRDGMPKIRYNGTLCYTSDAQVVVVTENVIYVPDETENTPEALREAAQKRIDDYLGAGKLTIEYVDNETVDECIERFIEKMMDALTYLPEEQRRAEAEDSYANFYQPYLSVFEDQPYYFTITVHGAKNDFVIVRDSSKMIDPSYKNIDVATEIEISADKVDFPLDTLMSAKEITVGTEYDKIQNLIDTSASVCYDLKLFSKSINDYVTELPNGKFSVKIPVPSNLDGKDLTVYYVDSTDNVIEYPVTVSNGYASFETNHFSIYTLGVAKPAPGSQEPQTPVTPQEPVTTQAPATTETPATTESTGTGTESAVPTGDEAPLAMILITLIASLAGIYMMYKKKEV